MPSLLKRQCSLTVPGEWYLRKVRRLYTNDQRLSTPRPAPRIIFKMLGISSSNNSSRVIWEASGKWSGRGTKVCGKLQREQCCKRERLVSSRSLSSWSVIRSHLQRRGADDPNTDISWQAARWISRNGFGGHPSRIRWISTRTSATARRNFVWKKKLFEILRLEVCMRW